MKVYHVAIVDKKGIRTVTFKFDDKITVDNLEEFEKKANEKACHEYNEVVNDARLVSWQEIGV
jgi:hypothetical protein